MTPGETAIASHPSCMCSGFSAAPAFFQTWGGATSLSGIIFQYLEVDRHPVPFRDQVDGDKADIRLFASETRGDYRKLLIRTTSLLSSPRVIASCRPLRDQSKLKICPDLKFVICFGSPPVRFCCQMLETPFRINT
jgi:hypothetical protein